VRFGIGLGDLRDHGLHRFYRWKRHRLELVIEVVIAFLQLSDFARG
jgi:hypothetical protein